MNYYHRITRREINQFRDEMQIGDVYNMPTMATEASEKGGSKTCYQDMTLVGKSKDVAVFRKPSGLIETFKYIQVMTEQGA